MIRKIVCFVLIAVLVLVGRDIIKRYPKADTAVTSMTKEARNYCETGWKSTRRFYKKNFNHNAMDKKFKAAKAPFTKLMKKRNSKKAASNRRSNIPAVNQPPLQTAAKTTQN